MKLYLLTLTLGIFCSTFAQRDIDEVLESLNTGIVPYISVSETRMHQINSEVIILDAREEKEYKVSHLAGAYYSGYSNFSLEGIQDHAKDKDQLIIVYCSLGVRSENIGAKLQDAGYTNVKNLYGGIIEWKNKGYPVINPQGNETEQVHTYSRYWGKWLINGKGIYE